MLANGKLPKKDIPDGPIQDLCKVIDKTPSDEWEDRVDAFSQLVSSIPDGSDYAAEEAWYNSAPILRHIAYPLAELLKDPRSTVVKRACESASELFEKCRGDGRYLLKDIMPAILAVHAQTNHVMRTYVQNMTMDALTVVPCKMAMPTWLDRMKSDKSITVREACAMYLGIGLQEWTEEGYLTVDVYNQVGSALIKAMRDPTQSVRLNAKKALENMHYVQPDIFAKLVDNRSITTDARVRKTLKKIQAGESSGAADDASAASSRVGSVGSRSYLGSTASASGMRKARSPQLRNNSSKIPQTIGVRTPKAPKFVPPAPRGKAGGLGPPVRLTTTTPFQAAAVPDSDDDLFNSTPTPQSAVQDESFQSEDTVDDMPVIANVNDLRETAKMRSKTGRASLLQRRFSRSNIRDENENPDNDTEFLNELLDGKMEERQLNGNTQNPHADEVSSHLPEHMRIAQELLESHKQHVDQIMETLKVEMDALRDFEAVLMEQSENGRPNEEEVLQYFESVGLCLEARTKAGTILQAKMDKISQGSG
ncbi:unnamed protein product [Cylindrotheca closterium]|uniref:CLASP N-terminal domain-containing protein n=1 Tax=Cylindrotheca closterium TaxID=2856 RepID=A0AAD2JPP0_9STRA|nr:unnamed protein product [Cylindrotheca closterium]